MTKHDHELLNQFIHHVGRRTRLTHESKALFLGFFKVGRGTNKEPDRIFGGEVLQRRFWKRLCSLSLSSAGSGMLSQRRYKSIRGSPRSLVSLSLEFTPELKTIALSLIPTFCHILSVAITPTAAAFVAKLRFPKGDTTAQPV